MALLGKKTGSVPAGPSPLMARINPLSDPRMRALVRMAATEGDYAAVQDAHALAMGLVAPGSDLWSWWLDGVEGLARNGDPDLALFLKFTREAAGIGPWGDLPAGARERLRALGG